MVKVATGGEITQDPSFCEKYPTASGCQVRAAGALSVSAARAEARSSVTTEVLHVCPTFRGVERAYVDFPKSAS